MKHALHIYPGFFFAVALCYGCFVGGCGDLSSEPEGRPLEFRWTVYDNTNSGIPHNFISAIAIDNDDRPWIGTFHNGIARFDGSQWIQWNTANSSLPCDSVWCLTVDRDNCLWVGTFNGLAKFDGSSWTVFNQLNSPLSWRSVLSLAVDNSGTLWIGCGHATGGGLLSFDGTHWNLYTPDNSLLPCRIINAIAVDHENTVWVGTAMFQSKGGLVKIQSGSWSLFDRSNSVLPYDWIDDLTVDPRGNVWVGQCVSIYLNPGVLYGSLVRFGRDGQQGFTPATSGKVSNRVGALASDKHGNIWLATSPDGPYTYDLTVFNGKEWFVFSSAYPDFPRMFIPDIAVDRANRIWLATEKGVFVLQYSPS